MWQKQVRHGIIWKTGEWFSQQDTTEGFAWSEISLPKRICVYLKITSENISCTLLVTTAFLCHLFKLRKVTRYSLFKRVGVEWQAISLPNNKLHGNPTFSLTCPHRTQTNRDTEKDERETFAYLHGESGCLLVIVVEQVGHEGGVVGEILTHSEPYGLTGKHAVAFYSVHENSRAAGEQSRRQQCPQQPHSPAAETKHKYR